MKKNKLKEIPQTFLTNRKKHLWILIGIGLLSYIRMLPNEFTLIDDYGTFVTNPLIKDFWASIADLRIQTILYTIFYHLFGLSAIPHHIMSISLHLVNIALFYLIFAQLFSLPVAFIASLLFAIHPINTEAVTWISGNPYLFNAAIYNLVLLYFVYYRKSNRVKHLYWSLGIFCVSMIFFRTVWLVIMPLILVVADQFFLRKKLNLLASLVILLYAVPIVIYVMFSMSGQITDRLSTRESSTPLNQQVLKPMVEGIPYTITTMSKLYLYPKDLMIYYDGNPITPTYYYIMYIGAFLYTGLTILLWRNRRVFAGILIMMVFALAPTMGPVKLVWFISERYLYYGTAFFTLGITLIIIPFIESKKYRTATIAVLLIVASAYLIRTIIRVGNYRTTETIAKATVATSPLGLRGHDDLANSYLLKEDYKRAMPIYHTSLLLVPDANTPVSNLGLIYLQYGLPTDKSLDPPRDGRSAEVLLKMGKSYVKQDRLTNAAFYLYQSHRNNPKNMETIYQLAEISLKAQNYSQAERLYTLILHQSGLSTKILNKVAFALSWQGKYEEAQRYLDQALSIDPRDPNTLSNMRQLVKIRAERSQQLGPIR